MRLKTRISGGIYVFIMRFRHECLLLRIFEEVIHGHFLLYGSAVDVFFHTVGCYEGIYQ